MADLVSAIKKIVRDYIDNENLSDLSYATYTGVGLKIDGKPVEVPLDMIDIPLHLQTITGKLTCDLTSGFEIKAKCDGKDVEVESIKLTDAPVTIQTGLVPGARVAVVQKKGANKYSIIDEVTG
ncbi:hypothetical protein [Anaerotruncus rubiinfantis]|uniref:hypothetical protein n=1 Tax=Anaerotruncus rubiinfantis TaxID=1720200 RepID=UPI003D7A04A9